MRSNCLSLTPKRNIGCNHLVIGVLQPMIKVYVSVGVSLYRSLRRSKTGDGHAEGRAAGIIHAKAGAELHAGGLAAVLAADAGAHAGTYVAALLHGHLDELAYAVLVENLEGVYLQNLLLQIHGQEAGDIVAAVAEGHLGQVIGTEAEELSFLSDLVSGDTSAGYPSAASAHTGYQLGVP